jgi:hypothetical protein
MYELPVVPSTFDYSGPPGVWAQCPRCKQQERYAIPLQLHSNVPGDFPVTCGSCREEFRVDPSTPVNPDVAH